MLRIEKLASGSISEEFQITFILANGVQLKANKLLVCQESSYVKSLLLRWDSSRQVDLTNLGFITEDSMNIFLEFVKSKKLPELDNEVCITKVFATANYLGAPNLLEKLEDRVQENISKEDLIDHILIARDWQFLGLERKLSTKMGTQSKEFLCNQTLRMKLLHMETEDFFYLMKVLRAPGINCDCETLFNFLDEWVTVQHSKK